MTGAGLLDPKDPPDLPDDRARAGFKKENVAIINGRSFGLDSMEQRGPGSFPYIPGSSVVFSSY